MRCVHHLRKVALDTAQAVAAAQEKWCKRKDQVRAVHATEGVRSLEAGDSGLHGEWGLGRRRWGQMSPEPCHWQLGQNLSGSMAQECLSLGFLICEVPVMVPAGFVGPLGEFCGD